MTTQQATPELATSIANVRASMSGILTETDVNELNQLIHRPGWTTPAERMLVTGILDSMQSHANALSALKGALLQGARAVGATSFSHDVLPLFRPIDITHMKPHGVILDDYAYMSDPAGDGTFPEHANARRVYGTLTGDVAPKMPPGGPYWGPDQLQKYLQWMDGGFQP